MNHMIIPALAACLLLEGCFASPFSSNEPAGPAAAPAEDLTPAAAFITANEPGASGSVDDEAFGGRVDITVEAEYASAGGSVCRRAVVSRPPHEAEIVVLCRTGENDWKPVTRVWGRGLKSEN